MGCRVAECIKILFIPRKILLFHVLLPFLCTWNFQSCNTNDNFKRFLAGTGGFTYWIHCNLCSTINFERCNLLITWNALLSNFRKQNFNLCSKPVVMRIRDWKPSIGLGIEPGVQLLRAIAVLSVVAFHMGLPIQGGYLGVDMFFVISGYVIFNSILREISANKHIDIVTFFARRAKRLLPALTSMLLVVTFFSTLFMSPSGLQKTAVDTVIETLLLRANYHLAATTGGYFDPDSQQNPLLHTWSLSVEEQFYLVLPLVVALVIVICRKKQIELALKFVLHAALFASFTYVFLRETNLIEFPPTSYFSIFNRIWEFTIGLVIATWIHNRTSKISRTQKYFFQIISLVGLCLAITVLSNYENLEFLAQVISVFSTAALILMQPVWTSKLEYFPFVRSGLLIGDASYSIYLWHWPAIVFAVFFLGNSSEVTILGGLAGVLIGLVSFSLIELPFRQFKIGQFRRWIPVTYLIFCLTFVFSTAIHFYDSDQKIYSEWKGGNLSKIAVEKYVKCSQIIPFTPSASECFVSRASRNIDTVVFGDSHALQLFIGLADIDKRSNYFVWSTSSPNSRNTDFNAFVRLLKNSDKPIKVLYASRWIEKTSKDHMPDWRAEMTRTIETLANVTQRIDVIEDVPNFSFSAGDCLAKPIIGSRRCTGVSHAHTEFNVFIETLSQRSSLSLSLLKVRQYFCVDAVTCDMRKNGEVLYLDSNHLNPYGSSYLATRVLANIPN